MKAADVLCVLDMVLGLRPGDDDADVIESRATWRAYRAGYTTAVRDVRSVIEAAALADDAEPDG